MPERGGGNRPMVKLFGAKRHRSRPRSGEGRAGRSCAPRRVLSDRCGPAGARASYWRQSTPGGTVAPMASRPRGGRLLRKLLPAHGRLRDGSAPSSYWIGPLDDTGAPGIAATVARGIEELNRRHGAGHFFLFHRGRMWSESEQRWIGWERKRGKLEQLNRFLIGESGPELEGFLCAGDRAQLEGIRFVITLDADTQLLRDTARRMIETLAHPLNQARLSPDGRHVVRGYTIIRA